jgi:hypothetical protein
MYQNVTKLKTFILSLWSVYNYSCIFYLCRKYCYKSLTDCLQRLLAVRHSPHQSPSLPSRPGPPPVPDPNALTPEDADRYVSIQSSSFESIFPLFFQVSLSILKRLSWEVWMTECWLCLFVCLFIYSWNILYHWPCHQLMSCGISVCISGWLTMPSPRDCLR